MHLIIMEDFGALNVKVVVPFKKDALKKMYS